MLWIACGGSHRRYRDRSLASFRHYAILFLDHGAQRLCEVSGQGRRCTVKPPRPELPPLGETGRGDRLLQMLAGQDGGGDGLWASGERCLGMHSQGTGARVTNIAPGAPGVLFSW